MSDIEISIVGKIRVNEDGKHCGKGCELSQTDSRCAFGIHREGERNYLCLAAQKEAEGGIYPQDIPKYNILYLWLRNGTYSLQFFVNDAVLYEGSTCGDIIGDGLVPYTDNEGDYLEVNVPIDGDRFYPVPQPQNANDEPSDGRDWVPIDSEDTRGE